MGEQGPTRHERTAGPVLPHLHALPCSPETEKHDAEFSLDAVDALFYHPLLQRCPDVGGYVAETGGAGIIARGALAVVDDLEG
jgi:hypothetical protein